MNRVDHLRKHLHNRNQSPKWSAVGRWVEHVKDDVSDVAAIVPEMWCNKPIPEEESVALACLMAEAPHMLMVLKQIRQFQREVGVLDDDLAQMVVDAISCAEAFRYSPRISA